MVMDALLTHWKQRDILLTSRFLNDHAAGRNKAPSIDVKRIAICSIDLPDLLSYLSIARPTPDSQLHRKPGLSVCRG